MLLKLSDSVCCPGSAGRSVEGWDLDSIKQLTFGDEGTTCTLSLRRDNENFQVSANCPDSHECTQANMGFLICDLAALRE